MSEINPEADISRHDKIDANDPEADMSPFERAYSFERRAEAEAEVICILEKGGDRGRHGLPKFFAPDCVTIE